MENLDLVHQETSYSQGPTHSRPSECGSQQAIQTRPEHPNSLVSPPRCLPSSMQQVALASNRPICHKVQQQVVSVYKTSSRFPGHCSQCTQSAMGGSGCICLPTFSHIGQSGGEAEDSPCKRITLIAPGWPNIPWFWDLVASFSQIPLSLPNLLTQPFNQIPHRNLTNQT